MQQVLLGVDSRVAVGSGPEGPVSAPVPPLYVTEENKALSTLTVLLQVLLHPGPSSVLGSTLLSLTHASFPTLCGGVRSPLSSQLQPGPHSSRPGEVPLAMRTEGRLVTGWQGGIPGPLSQVDPSWPVPRSPSIRPCGRAAGRSGSSWFCCTPGRPNLRSNSTCTRCGFLTRPTQTQ